MRLAPHVDSYRPVHAASFLYRGVRGRESLPGVREEPPPGVGQRHSGRTAFHQQLTDKVLQSLDPLGQRLLS